MDFDPQSVQKTDFIKIKIFKTIHRVGCIRPTADMFLEHILDPKSFENIGF